MESEKINKIFDKIRPGDIIFTRSNDLIAKIIRFVTNGQINHCAIYIGNKQIIESQLGVGVRRYYLEDYLNQKDTEVYYGLLKDVSINQINEAIITAKGLLGRKYDLFGQIGVLVKILAVRLEWTKVLHFYSKNITKDSNAFWCSELVAYSFGNNGTPLTDVDYRYATPEDIASSKKIDFKQKL